MKVLALATDAFGGFGGIAEANRTLFTAMGELGHEVTVLPRNGRAAALPAGVRQLAPSSGKLAYSLRAATSGRFDLLFCGHLYMAPLAALLARGRPYWVHLHGIEAWKKPSAAVARAVSGAAMATAVSRYTRRRFLEWADVDPARVRVLPNAVDPRFSPGPRPERLAARHGLSGKKVVLTVGRISAGEKYKGHDRVIAAFPEVLKRYRDAVYVVAGDGDDRSRLETLARTTGVDGSVRFIGKPSEAELADVYRMADVFAMPSTGEGFGIVFLEAMACGIPVIAGGEDGSRDPLRDGLAGRLVDPALPSSLAAAIIAALDQGRALYRPENPFVQTRLKSHLQLLLNLFFSLQ